MPEIPNNKIEPIVAKLICSHGKYANVFLEFYHKNAGWFEDNGIDSIVMAVLKCYEKYSKFPSWKTVDILLSKYLDDEKYKKAERKIDVIKNINITDYDEEILDTEFLEWIKRKGTYLEMFNFASSQENEDNGYVSRDFLDKLEKLFSVNLDRDLGLIYTRHIDDHIEEISKPDTHIAWGFENMDNATQGGPWLEGKSLSVFVGETHIGKSVFLSNIALNMARRGKFVVIYSLEMSETVYGMRVDAHNSEVGINNLAEYPDQIRNAVSNLKKYGDGEIAIKEFPSGETTTRHIRDHLNQLITYMGRNPDAVFVDYLSLLKPSARTGDSLYERVGRVALELRGLSYPFGCPFITAAQINRDGYDDNSPSLSKVSDSMKLAFDADFISILWRAEGDYELARIRQVIRKDRFGGGAGKNLIMNMDLNTLRLSEYQDMEADGDEIASDIQRDLQENAEL